MSQNNGTQKSVRAFISAYLALGGLDPESGRPSIRTKLVEGKKFYLDQILAVWRKTNQYGELLTGILGSKESNKRVVLRPAYVILESVHTEENGEDVYRDGTEVLGVVRVIRPKDKSAFPIIRLFANAGDGNLEVVEPIGFVNGTVPDASSEESADTGIESDAAMEFGRAF
jgi:hypothetical protein